METTNANPHATLLQGIGEQITFIERCGFWDSLNWRSLLRGWQSSIQALPTPGEPATPTAPLDARVGALLKRIVREIDALDDRRDEAYEDVDVDLPDFADTFEMLDAWRQEIQAISAQAGPGASTPAREPVGTGRLLTRIAQEIDALMSESAVTNYIDTGVVLDMFYSWRQEIRAIDERRDFASALIAADAEEDERAPLETLVDTRNELLRALWGAQRAIETHLAETYGHDPDDVYVDFPFDTINAETVKVLAETDHGKPVVPDSEADDGIGTVGRIILDDEASS